MIVGTAGHIDHGKTALVKALTGVDTDRLPEERARGLSIELGYAYLTLDEDRVLGFVDVPGHERFVKTMVAGMAGIDFLLLVVAADDGPMPQTREHLQVADLLGFTRGAIALTKIDRVSAARREAAADEIESLIAGTGLAGSPLFTVSATDGTGIEALKNHLLAATHAAPVAKPDGNFRFAVDRSFSLKGVGTVVTGTVLSGSATLGDQLRILPNGLSARLRGLHAHNRPAEQALAGQRCALNLSGSGIHHDMIHRGDWVVAGERAPLGHHRVDVDVTLLGFESAALRHWSTVHVHHGCDDVTGRIAVLEADRLAPGQTGLAQIVADRPLYAVHGDRFILRDAAARHTVGGGVLLDPSGPRYGRRKPERLAALKALKEAAGPQEALAALAWHTSPRGVDFDRFVLDWNLTDSQAQILQTTDQFRIVETPRAKRAFTLANWRRHADDILHALRELHGADESATAVTVRALRKRTACRLATDIFSALVDELTQAGKVERRDAGLALPGHQANISPDDARLWSAVRPLLEEHRFQPPRTHEIADRLRIPPARVRALLQELAKHSEVRLVVRERYFLSDTVRELAGIVEQLCAANPNNAVAAAELRDAIGTGRKAAIEVLEYFDRRGLTMRVGDRHILRPAATRADRKA